MRRATTSPIRVQLCGRFGVERDSRPVELPGRQCRLLFGYLVLHRNRPRSREELAVAVWGDDPPPAVDSALSALVSKIRKAVAPDAVEGRRELQAHLPDGSFVDAEAAQESVHRGQAAATRGDLPAAYNGYFAAVSISARTFLPGFDLPWVDGWRNDLAEIHVEAVEGFARAALAIGGGELAAADRASRRLVELAPYRETAYALRMDVLAARGNVAEALLAYDGLRRRLRDDLGVDPCPELRHTYERLLSL